MTTTTTTDNKDEDENDIHDDDDDDIFSVTSSYKYNSTNDLGILSCSALITADCMGTGILALPYDINQIMGTRFGLFFLIINLFPINLYAGTILCYSADYVEREQQQSTTTSTTTTTTQNKQILKQQQQGQQGDDDGDGDDEKQQLTSNRKMYKLLSHHPESQEGKRLLLQNNNNNNVQIYSSIAPSSISSIDDDDDDDDDENINNNNNNDKNEEETNHLLLSSHHYHHHHHHDTATFDFIGMTSALFHSSIKTKCVLFLYYTNIFLVLGNYILVMSHAVVALFDNNNDDSSSSSSSSDGSDSSNNTTTTSKSLSLCIPTAGIIASTLMFAISQLRTMANLGRNVSILSLFALFIVVIQCLYYSGGNNNNNNNNTTGILKSNIAQEEKVDNKNNTTILSTTTSSSTSIVINYLSAMSSIGFATGSQKLFLNIRHECINRNKSPISLGIALFIFGTCYIIVVLLSGPDPPEFLFDAIPKGIQRRIAGFFLWVHVAVSYAINSQAICSSMDRIIFYNWGPIKHLKDYQRWIILTGMIAISAFVVANAIPFFKDLLAFIGAVTSVPLSLLLPAIYYRKVQGISILFPTKDSISSYSLLVFATLFMVLGCVASMTSILNDWEHHQGGFFSCQ